MNQDNAIEMFNALAQETRLDVFRLLVREEPRGLPVSEISRQLDIVQSTLSGHLGILRRVGLLQSTRHQREIHYSANLESIANINRFLLEDCCDGRVGNCEKILPLIKSC
jgi:DNA-binding transcriptional ArsR family regulator